MFHFNTLTSLVTRGALAFTLAALAGCGAGENSNSAEPAATAGTNAASSINGESISRGDANNWLSNGRTYDEQRHSPVHGMGSRRQNRRATVGI